MERRDRHLAVMMSDRLRTALSRAAESRHQTASEFVRQAVVDRLRSDQVQIEPTSTTMTTPSSSPVEQVA